VPAGSVYVGNTGVDDRTLRRAADLGQIRKEAGEILRATVIDML
jgi:hypothetical protein